MTPIKDSLIADARMLIVEVAPLKEMLRNSDPPETIRDKQLLGAILMEILKMDNEFQVICNILDKYFDMKKEDLPKEFQDKLDDMPEAIIEVDGTEARFNDDVEQYFSSLN